MGGIADALTGGGARDAADAQVQAAGEAMVTQRQTLAEQLKLGRESLALQEKMFDTALELSDPYRSAGNVALARYESLLYGIPIEKTASYQAFSAPQGTSSTKSRDDFRAELSKSFTTGTKENAEGRWIKGGDTWTWSGGGDYQMDNAGLEAAVDAKMAEQEQLSAQQKLDTRDAAFAGTDVTQATDFTATPGYEFRRDEGQKALERSAAARSGVLSGAQLKAQERYAQDYATQEFDNVLRRIGGLVDTGANMSGAAGNQALSSAGMQSGILSNMAGQQGVYGSNVAGLQTQVGAARASGYLGTQQAGANVLNMAAGFAGSGFGGGGGGAGGGSGFTDAGWSNFLASN